MHLTKKIVTESNFKSYYNPKINNGDPYALSFLTYSLLTNSRVFRNEGGGFDALGSDDLLYKSTYIPFTDYHSLMKHPNLMNDRLYATHLSAGYGHLVHDNILYFYMIDSGYFNEYDKKLRELLRNGLSIYDALEFLCI